MFEAYKNKHKNETAYLIGTGPTISHFPANRYDGVYVGVNESYMLEDTGAKLDYLITEKQFPKLKIPVFHCDTIESNGENCFKYRSHITEIGPFHGSNKEIIDRFNGASSMIYHGFFLAAHMGCNKIHLVGCDCTKSGGFSYERLSKGWQYIKSHMNENHPNVEIININPVGLKSMFRSLYTVNSSQ